MDSLSLSDVMPTPQLSASDSEANSNLSTLALCLLFKSAAPYWSAPTILFTRWQALSSALCSIWRNVIDTYSNYCSRCRRNSSLLVRFPRTGDSSRSRCDVRRRATRDAQRHAERINNTMTRKWHRRAAILAAERVVTQRKYLLLH